jgi:hypothetical protein
LYGQLLILYLRVPTGALLKSLGSAGIEANMQAKPSFVDDECSAEPDSSDRCGRD